MVCQYYGETCKGEKTLQLDILKYKNEKQSEAKVLFYSYLWKQKN